METNKRHQYTDKQNEKFDDFFSVHKPFHLDFRYPIEYDLSKLNKKELRRLNSIVRRLVYVHPENIVYRPNLASDLSKAHELYDKVGLDMRERRNHWIYNKHQQSKVSSTYRKMPKRVRKDNQDVRNVGTGNYHRGSTVRYPSKKRSKRTWRKFYELFPHLKPENND